MLGLRTARLAAFRGLARPRPAPARPLTRGYALPTRPLLRQRLVGRRFNSSSVHPNPHTAKSSNEAPKSASQRLKELTKTYGSYAVIMYLVLSALDFSLAFAIVHTVGVERIEPYTRRLVQLYRKLRHGEEGAAALEAADEARRAAEEADNVADEAEEAAQQKIGKKSSKRWWDNKALWAEVALAYSIHKVGFLPVRAGLTVAWTPKVVNFLRARGWIGRSGTKRAIKQGEGKVRSVVQSAKDKAKDVVD
ncbi:hypothetical protein CspeluHIS016_0305980 [Cutaneotrichosporon spelunceum]|uniref:DUF1279 domain-containing protein n=1 Tax=Cutaneotrichosporon spelunceum TaxID=1672016 RepID=A0AAD3TTS7_9TREE|nr:hypothetical protein CspeluHIS016_0305980 [Cutaneotrichosporon spelunceum]